MGYLEKSWYQHYAFLSPSPELNKHLHFVKVPSLVCFIVAMENKRQSYYEELEESGLEHVIFQRM